MTKLTLISYVACPFVQRVIIALKEKDLEYENVGISIFEKPDWFLVISPLGKVPLLKVQEDDGSEKVIFESSAILEYLEEQFPEKPLYPSKLIERAHHRSWMEFSSSLIIDFSKWIQEKDFLKLPDLENALYNKLNLVEHIVQGPYFSGSSFTCVDAAFAPFFFNLDAVEAKTGNILTIDLPKISTWRINLAKRKSFQDSILIEDYAEKYTSFWRDACSAVLNTAVKDAA